MADRHPVIRIRRIYGDDEVTLGMLSFKTFSCFTVENPWLENVPYVSCIPPGRYLLKLGRYNAGGYDAYEVQEVQGRTLIKMHIANLPTEVDGCMGVGDSITRLNGELAVSNSRDTFDRLMEMLDRAKYVWLALED